MPKLTFSEITITESHLSALVALNQYVVVNSCYFEKLDLSTLNDKVFIEDSRFVDSFICVPNLNKQLHNCEFMFTCPTKNATCPVRTAIRSIGYYSPVKVSLI